MRWSQAEALNRASLRTHYNPILMLWSGIQAKVTGHYRAVFYLREPKCCFTLLQTQMIQCQLLQKHLSTLLKKTMDCMRLNGEGVNVNKFQTSCFRPSNCWFWF